MTVEYKTAQKQLKTSYGTPVYTAPLTVDSATVVFGVCHNISDTDTELTVNAPPVSITESTANEYITTRKVTKPSPDLIEEIVGMVLGPGDFISAKAGDDDFLNFRIGVKEVTS